jgi:hypothetical protein
MVMPGGVVTEGMTAEAMATEDQAKIMGGNLARFMKVDTRAN